MEHGLETVLALGTRPPRAVPSLRTLPWPAAGLAAPRHPLVARAEVQRMEPAAGLTAPQQSNQSTAARQMLRCLHLMLPQAIALALSPRVPAVLQPTAPRAAPALSRLASRTPAATRAPPHSPRFAEPPASLRTSAAPMPIVPQPPRPRNAAVVLASVDYCPSPLLYRISDQLCWGRRVVSSRSRQPTRGLEARESRPQL